MSVEIVLYQEATALRMCDERVILALAPLLFWGERVRVQNFSQSPAAAPAAFSALLFLIKSVH